MSDDLLRAWPSGRRPPELLVLRAPVAAVGVGLFGAATWWVWLGWDHQYYEVDGVAQGPYRAWQVVGCALAMSLACVLARRWAGHWVSLLVLPAAGVVGFAEPWASDAAAEDVTGLWLVGLFLLLLGGYVGLLVVLVVTDAVSLIRAQQDRNRAPGPL